jgi:regulator of sirC expression with transglutaminase-like and TPR domain
MGDELNFRQRTLLDTVLSAHRQVNAFREAWLQWPLLDDEYAKLETAFELLAQFQYGWVPPVRLREFIDDIADRFRSSGRATTPVSLSRYLFIGLKLRGNVDDYYNPLNSNLIHVIQNKLGIPISLACIYMLVGSRMGYEITGCNIPGHFLSRIPMGGKELLVDCFNSGRVLSQEEVDNLNLTLAEAQRYLIHAVPTAEEIIVRVLHNLINAYERVEDIDKSLFARSLLGDLTQAMLPHPGHTKRG